MAEYPILDNNDIKQQYQKVDDNDGFKRRQQIIEEEQQIASQMSIQESPKNQYEGGFNVDSHIGECAICNDRIFDFEKGHFLSNCSDFYCKKCFVKQIDTQYVKKYGTIQCKSCQSVIIKADIKVVKTDLELDALDNLCINSNLDLIVCCSCNEKIEFVQGNSNDGVQDQEGQALSQELMLHYADNRFTCPKCKNEQCRSCQAIPYHLGKNCEQQNQYSISLKCRYCDDIIEKPNQRGLQVYRDICVKSECQKKKKMACNQLLDCGHPCCGLKGEEEHLHCLFEDCKKNIQGNLQAGDDYCNICFVEGLSSAPCIRSTCGHIFHHDCLQHQLETRWSTARIVLNFCLCPLCKQWIQLEAIFELQDTLEGFKKLFGDIRGKSMARLKHDGREKDDKLTTKASPFFEQPEQYSMAIYSYYECFQCKQPYFGGLKDCERAMNENQEFNPKELICPNCCDIPIEKCQRHGDDFIQFKCRFCCSTAQWFCFGTTHFCEPCHRKAGEVMKIPKDKLPVCLGKGQCPLSVDHKPAGEESPLGCSLCRNLKMMNQDF